jgi:uncharacterized protein with HEPN domain
MLSRAQLKYLLDMRQVAADIALHLGTATREEFLRNKTMTRAVEREFEILGEAARHVDEETRARLPEVAFRSAVAMRNRLSHDYTNVNLDVLWSTAKHDVPVLQAALETFLRAHDEVRSSEAETSET